MKTECVFCEIIKGRMPSCSVHEDSDTMAFMDIAPIAPGHTLVIPKEHVEFLMEARSETLGKLISAARKIARAQMKALKADGINIMQANGRVAGQTVPHLHFHVIPRFKDDGHHWNWKTTPYAKDGDMENTAERIKSAME